jgi:O-methyltransferase
VRRRSPSIDRGRQLARRLYGTARMRALERIRRLGFERITHSDLEPEFLALHSRCAEYTGTSILRMNALYEAMRYVLETEIPGDYVECGAWRGGSSMLASLCAQRAGATQLRFWLYDTFMGMTQPTPEDGDVAWQQWKTLERVDHNDWCYAPLEEVRRNMLSTGLAPGCLELVEGRVEETIPAQAPSKISLLRLDTDWYSSTKHELIHLFPRLQPGGVLIVDDFGFWQGARLAVQEYFRETGIRLLLVRIDETGRLAIKPPLAPG